jgi:ABC-type cobalamin transport system permease subunit
MTDRSERELVRAYFVGVAIGLVSGALIVWSVLG